MDMKSNIEAIKTKGLSNLNKEDIESVEDKILSAASGAIDHVKENLSEYLQQGKEKLEDLGSELENQFKRHTVKSVLVGAAIVVGIAGLIWRSKSSK